MEKRNVYLRAYLDSLAKHTIRFMHFCTNLSLFLSKINDVNPACSVLTGGFSVRFPQWRALDKENNEEPEFIVSLLLQLVIAN